MGSFAERFKYLREHVMKWTQDEAAERLGISRSTIAGYESESKNRLPREETLHKIADIFGVTLDYLMGRTDDPHGSADEGIAVEEREFLEWVKNNLEGSFFYDFAKSPEEQKAEMMRGLRLVWELEKNRKPGQKQGE